MVCPGPHAGVVVVVLEAHSLRCYSSGSVPMAINRHSRHNGMMMEA
jgi:hypothetical protein